MLYGGEAYTLATRLGVDLEAAEAGYQRFIRDFPVVGKKRREIFDKYQAVSQPGGLGSQVIWRDPADYVEEPILGHRRYFTLENRIEKVLFQLANRPPAHWSRLRLRVERSPGRLQTVCGALQSSLYGCVFQQQGSVQRAAANHEIQSADKTCKRLQRNIWGIQPSGVHEWLVQPLNCHDEVLTPTHPDYINKVRQVVDQTIKEFQIEFRY